MTDETPTGREPSNDGPSSAVEAPGRPGAYPTDTLPSATLSGRYSDDALEAGLRRVLTAINGLPPKVDVRPDPGLHTHDIADTIPGCVDCAARAAAEARRDFEQLGCSVYPEGDGHHDYRVTASSHYGVGLDHPDFRQGETVYRCRNEDCGDVFVALDSEMAALDEDRWTDG